MLATVVIPFADYHESLVSRAVASVEAQTVNCAVVIVRDDQRRGVAWARNKGLAQVATEYVVFLDADDQLAPTFVERCYAARRRDRYLYCDWLQNDTVHPAPDCAWVDRTWHPVTTWLPTAWVRVVGGFDERLTSGGEDTEFYLKLVTSGFCGQRLAEPLFIYGAEGQRSKAFVEGADYHPTLQLFTKRYGGKAMACCGETVIGQQMPIGQQQSGDVLVAAQWHGNRPEVGRVSGRIYRAGWGKQIYVALEDVNAAPHLWKRVETEPPPDDFQLAVEMLAPTLEPGMMDIARRMGVRVSTPPPVTPVAEGGGKPDVGRIVGVARRAFGQS